MATVPGLAGAVLETPEVAAEIICDGFHVHPALVRAAIGAKGASRVMAVTDATSVAGLPPGERGRLGGQEITAINNSVSRAVEAYDPAANECTVLPNMQLARHGIGGGVIGTRLHIAGGHITAAFSGGEPLNSPNHDALELGR